MLGQHLLVDYFVHVGGFSGDWVLTHLHFTCHMQNALMRHPNSSNLLHHRV